MKREGLVTDVTTVGSPDKAEHAIFRVILAGYFFLPIQTVHICGQGATL